MKYDIRGSQRTKRASRVPKWQCQLGVMSSPVPDCAVDKTISNMFHWSHVLPSGHSKALSQTGGKEGKSARLTGVKRW